MPDGSCATGVDPDGWTVLTSRRHFSASAGGNLNVTTGSNAIAITSGAITDNGGAVTLVKSGTGGNLTLTAANSYAGGTVLNAGTISIPADASLGGATGGLTVSGSGTLQVTAAVTVGATRGITLANGAILTLDNVANAVTIGGGAGGDISGTGGIAYIGTTGNLTLSGANTFTGVVNVNPGGVGNLIANNAAALGNGNNAVNLTATAARGGLQLNNNLTVGSTSGGGATGGGIILQANALTVGGNNENTTYAGIITSRGTPATSLIKTGTGVLTLTGANTFTGGIRMVRWSASPGRTPLPARSRSVLRPPFPPTTRARSISPAPSPSPARASGSRSAAPGPARSRAASRPASADP